ncbi:MAG: DUF3040 domain-containing protein [Actinobacteria bacterium]|nr:DUF3040 domain-containing protein [Actinomycetota bacterium]
MGLPVRQRRVLDHIDQSLRGSDPKLVARYAIFARLAQGEDIPRIEQLRYGVLTRLAWLRAILAVICTRLHLRINLRPRQRAMVFYPLAIALAVSSIVFAAKSGTDRNCSPVRIAAAKNFAKSSACGPPGTPTPFMFGR